MKLTLISLTLWWNWLKCRTSIIKPNCFYNLTHTLPCSTCRGKEGRDNKGVEVCVKIRKVWIYICVCVSVCVCITVSHKCNKMVKHTVDQEKQQIAQIDRNRQVRHDLQRNTKIIQTTQIIFCKRLKKNKNKKNSFTSKFQFKVHPRCFFHKAEDWHINKRQNQSLQQSWWPMRFTMNFLDLLDSQF